MKTFSSRSKQHSRDVVEMGRWSRAYITDFLPRSTGKGALITYTRRCWIRSQVEKWNRMEVNQHSHLYTSKKEPALPLLSLQAFFIASSCPWAPFIANGKTNVLSLSPVNAPSVSESNAYSTNSIFICEESASLVHGSGFLAHILRSRLFIAIGKFSYPQFYRCKKQRPWEV